MSNQNEKGRNCAVCGEFFTVAEGASVFTVCSDKCFYGPPRPASECGSSHWCTVHNRDVLDCFKTCRDSFYILQADYDRSVETRKMIDNMLLDEKVAHDKTVLDFKNACDVGRRIDIKLTKSYQEVDRLRAALQEIVQNKHSSQGYGYELAAQMARAALEIVEFASADEMKQRAIAAEKEIAELMRPKGYINYPPRTPK